MYINMYVYVHEYYIYECVFLQARKAISLRAQMEKKVASKERESKEDRLRDLAKVARDKRVGIHSGPGADGEQEEEAEREGERGGEGEEAATEREVLRQERHRERERERRLARAHPDKRCSPPLYVVNMVLNAMCADSSCWLMQ